MQEVWRDMERTDLPSWVSPAPARIGTTKAGKLSADQWRSAGTIHLVVTLTRLWGSEPVGSRRYRMLANFMDLVAATKLATMRTMTTSRIDLFIFHMKRYLDEYLELYESAVMYPGQHMSLHFQELLTRFGPTHGWRCWAFERMNYKLQRVPTNKKFGKLHYIVKKSKLKIYRRTGKYYVGIVSKGPAVTHYDHPWSASEGFGWCRR